MDREEKNETDSGVDGEQGPRKDKKGETGRNLGMRANQSGGKPSFNSGQSSGSNLGRRVVNLSVLLLLQLLVALRVRRESGSSPHQQCEL